MKDPLGLASTTAIQQYLRLARSERWDWPGALRAAGLNEADLESPDTTVAGSQFQSFLLNLIASTGDPLLGLKSAEFVQPGSYNVLGYIVMSCATVGDALEKIAPYERLVGDMGTTRIDPHPDSTSVIWHCHYPHPRVRPHMIANVLASWVSYCRWLANHSSATPREVTFEFALPEGTRQADFERVFGCPVAFSQTRSAVIIPQRVLAIPLRQPDNTLRETLEAHARERMNRLSTDESLSTRAQVKLALRQALQQGAPRQEQIADTLGITTRTLQRRLGEEDTSFQNLLDEVRLEQARQALANGQESIADIAERLGYAETRSFLRRFKQWTGTTPGEFREHYRSGPGNG